MDALHLLFTAVTVIFIAATMFAAGLGTTLSALRGIVPKAAMSQKAVEPPLPSTTS
ncbi:MAG TPA: hypothetical protein VHZ03_26435 [Trebonia sp.]|jgi:hypothetical protein|nr:hypothetical protein [Trebonia sp.]